VLYPAHEKAPYDYEPKQAYQDPFPVSFRSQVKGGEADPGAYKKTPHGQEGGLLDKRQLPDRPPQSAKVYYSGSHTHQKRHRQIKHIRCHTISSILASLAQMLHLRVI
jgi:hypothetical protein